MTPNQEAQIREMADRLGARDVTFAPVDLVLFAFTVETQRRYLVLASATIDGVSTLQNLGILDQASSTPGDAVATLKGALPI